VALLPSSTNRTPRDHRRVVLNLIGESPDGTTRAQIARSLDLSRSAVSDLVDDLLRTGLVREKEKRQSRAGRRPIGLEINPGAGQVVGVDVGATHIRVILADIAARPLAEVNTTTDIRQGPEKTLSEVRRLVDRALRDGESNFGRVRAVGIGVPGPVVSEQGMVVAPPIMPGWDQYPIRESLVRGWDRLVAVHNDANMGALGEWMYGASRHSPNLVFLKVGTGIGLGMILGGQLHEGQVGAAGEIGHQMLVENGPLCSCGNRGCLEALAGGGAIARQARELVQQGQRTHLAKLASPEKLTARDVAEAAAQGDHLAQQLLAQAGEYIGIALANVVNVLNPGVVIIGGGVALAGDLLLEPVRAQVRKRSLQAGGRAAQVMSASLGQRSMALGAVATALSLCFDHVITLATSGQLVSVEGR
jgi:glucokinase-like ROK family protein